MDQNRTVNAKYIKQNKDLYNLTGNLKRSKVKSVSGPEARRAKRYKVLLFGKISVNDGDESSCQTVDVSAYGVAVMSKNQVKLGDEVIGYFEQLGRISGKVVRVFSGGFAIAIDASQHRRQKIDALAASLAGDSAKQDKRSQLQESKGQPMNRITLLDGRVVIGRLKNVTLDGTIVEADIPSAEVGTVLLLGNIAAKVIKAAPHRFTVRFMSEEIDGPIEAFFS